MHRLHSFSPAVLDDAYIITALDMHSCIDTIVGPIGLGDFF